MQRGELAMNDRQEWLARNLGATFVDPNSWIRDGDFGRDGLHLNRNGARQPGTTTEEFVKLTAKVERV